jgi:hypothetical protein
MALHSFFQYRTLEKQRVNHPDLHQGERLLLLVDMRKLSNRMYRFWELQEPAITKAGIIFNPASMLASGY